MKNYSAKILNFNIKVINTEIYQKKCRIENKHFTRNRKMGSKEISYYLLNKRGLTSKMEIINFNDIVNVGEISSPAVFKQREKFNPEAIKYLITENLKFFYKEHEDEVKTYKGYILIGIDGSDFEIPNNKKTREKYNGKLQTQCARITVSTVFDLLNHYTIDTIIEHYNYDELLMAKEHLNNVKETIGKYKTIRVMDRNYRSLSDIYYSNKNNDKFIVKISSSVYKKETSKMKTNDELISLKYQYDRVRFYKEKDTELYEYLNNGNEIEIRCVKIELKTGEIEYLLTNLEKTEFDYNEIAEIYKTRWKIETNYHYLKNSLKIESITSSKDLLIKQDILSQIMVYNILQAFINDNDKSILQEKYKNKMKTNVNMAVGLFKNILIYILIEPNEAKRTEMLIKFYNKLQKYIVPIKPNRNPVRKTNPKNKYHINKRKSF